LDLQRRRANDDPRDQGDIQVSNRAVLREEATNPFAKVRLYGSGFLGVATLLGSFIASTRLLASVLGAPRAAPVAENAQTLGIDVACFAFFVTIFTREKAGLDKRLRVLQREEVLSQLPIELPGGKRRTLMDFQGFARPVIVSASSDMIMEAMQNAEEFKMDLVNRSVLVVPVPASGEAEDKLDEFWTSWKQNNPGADRPFMVKPRRVDQWNKWIDDQKKDAKVDPESSVWVSLRKDGRVRSSGKGMPPWIKFVKSLPVDKGLFGGFLDGMDGSVTPR
jgi:hypothetical protein